MQGVTTIQQIKMAITCAQSAIRKKSHTARELKAQCLKLSGQSAAFYARSIKYSRDGLVLVSPKALKPGTNLIVRLLNIPPASAGNDTVHIRATGLAEVCWVEEIMDAYGLAYAMSLKYVTAD